MGVLVALPVAQIFHEARWRVADHEGNRLGEVLYGVLLCQVVGRFHGVGSRHEGEVDDGFGEMNVAFRHAKIVAGLIGGGRDDNGVGIREAHVLRRETQHPAGYVERILSGLEHAREPVNRGVRIRIAHGLVQGGDEIVMLLSVFVIEE